VGAKGLNQQLTQIYADIDIVVRSSKTVSSGDVADLRRLALMVDGVVDVSVPRTADVEGRGRKASWRTYSSGQRSLSIIS